ncbi:hypothetical protein [Dyella sp.]|uniref:hypothetical protein n=1 Tax=Dyella sp. TaxID=1869338 RepID=UPI0039C8A2DC
MPMSQMPDAAMAGMSMDPDCPMGMDHAGQPHHGAPCHPDDPTARCGYCVMFMHTPAAGFGSALAWAPLYLPPHAPHGFSQHAQPCAPLLSARSRGPPPGADV